MEFQRQPDDLPVTISRYRTIERIGTGGMGSVYRAYDTALAREVAIKVLPTYLGSDPALRERFQHEAKLASSISHPNVVSIYEVGEVGGAPYIVTEYIPGASLAARTAAGPLPIAEVLQISTQIGRALAAAHEHHIVHRDLKPSNVMITPGGKAMLVDFGLALLGTSGALGKERADARERTQAASPAGTLLYMSPEQLLGEPFDSRSDIYSFGALVYEMATGRPPFRGETGLDLVHSVLHGEPSPPILINPEIPHQLEEIILKCLRKRPEERFQSMQEVLGALHFVQRFEGIRAVACSSSAASIAIPTGWLPAIEPFETTKPRTTAWVVLTLSFLLILVGLIPLYGTTLGFGMTFGASVVAYECYLLLKACEKHREE